MTAVSIGNSILNILRAHILFSIVAVSFFIPTNNMQEFLFLHILTITYSDFFDSSHPNECEVEYLNLSPILILTF